MDTLFDRLDRALWMRWLDRSLANAILAGMLAVTAALVLVLGVLSLVSGYSLAERHVLDTLRGHARLVNQELDRRLAQNLERVREAAASPALAQAGTDPSRLRAALVEHRGLGGELLGQTLMDLALLNREGAYLAGFDGAGPLALNLPVEPLRQALDSGRPRLALLRGERMRLLVVVPMGGASARWADRAVAGLFDLSAQAEKALAMLPEGVSGALLDDQGRLLAGVATAPIPNLVRDEHSLQGSEELGILGLRLALSQPAERAYQAWQRSALSYGALGVAAFIIALLAARRLSRRITDPLQRLSAQADLVAQGGEARPEDFTIHGHGEIDVLAQAFSRMLTKVRDNRIDLENQVIERTRSLEETRRRLIGVLGSVHDMIYSINLDQNRCLYASQAAQAIFAAPSQALESGEVFWLAYIHPDDRAHYEEAFADARRQGAGEAYYRVNLPNGALVYVHDRFQLAFDEEGRPSHMDGVIRDITSQAVADAARAQAEATLHLHDRAMDQSSNGIIITDMSRPGQPVIYVNPAFERITGYSAEEALGRNCDFLQAGDRDQPGIEQLRRAIREEREQHVVLRNYRKDGAMFWNELSISPVRDALGRVTHYIGVQNDITARRRAEQALAEGSRRLHTIFSLSPDGFVSFDADGALTHMNPAFQRMVAADANSLLGCSLDQFEAFMRERSDPAEPYRAVPRVVDVQVGRESASDLRFALKRPEPRILQRSLRYSEHRQAALTLYFRDVTKEAEVERMKSEFLSTAAHELRTPMASIMGFSELLLHREYPRERQRDMLSTIHRQSQRLTNLLNELLDLARIEARQGKDFKRATLDLGPWLRETLASYLAPNDPRRVTFILPETLPRVEADRDKLQQALFNVLSNAYKYSPGGGEIRLEALEHDFNGESFIGLRISDQGLGMSPEQLQHVFERFWRADTTGHIPGTGLGLSLVKEIVELHGGYAEVASEQGLGTQVTLWLPVKTVEMEPLALAA